MRVGHRQHQTDRPAFAQRQCAPLQLRRPQLGLKVHRMALDLDVQDLGRGGEDQIGSSPIGPVDRDLQRSVPPRVRAPDDAFGDVQLPGIPQGDTSPRKEPKA